MVGSFALPDTAELGRYSEILADLTSEVVRRKYSTVLVSGNQQLILLNNGVPILIYDVNQKQELGSGRYSDFVQRFIGNFEHFKHFVMLYDDPKFARLLEFQYARTGLERGQRCVYAVSEDDPESPESIKKQMDLFGIKTSHYARNDRLHLVRIPDPAKDPRGFVSGCLGIADSLARYQGELAVRIIVNMRHQLKTKIEFEEHSEFETMVDSKLVNFHGSVMCSHYIGSYCVDSHGAWLKSMLQAHGINLVVGSRQIMASLLDKGDFLAKSTSFALSRKEEKIQDFETDIKNVSDDVLERKISEVRNDIEFCTEQVKADLGSYSSTDLQDAITGISSLKKKVEMMKAEYSKRSLKP